MNIGTGRLNTHEKKRRYINFYGNLMKLCDGYVVDVLDTLRAHNLLDNTLVIRTSDHAKWDWRMADIAGKNFNFYEETMRVPLVYSKPGAVEQTRDLAGDGLARRPSADAREPRQRAALSP